MTYELFQTFRSTNIKSLTPRRIMLVEDDAVSRWLVRVSVRDSGVLMTCGSAASFYERYFRFRPDIVFMDLNLPDGDGQALMKWIARNDPEIPVYALSSMDDKDTIDRFLDEGGTGYITKPFRPEVLRTQIASCPFPLNR